MPTKSDIKFGIKTYEKWNGEWSLGICLTKTPIECYFLINLFKWVICIGKLIQEEEYNDI